MTIIWSEFSLPPINLWNVWNMQIPYEATILWDTHTEKRKGILGLSDAMSDMQWEKEHQQLAPHSEHYQKAKPEPIEVIEGWNLDFTLGNVIKYIGRYKFKGQSKQDLEKALWYLERAVKRL